MFDKWRQTTFNIICKRERLSEREEGRERHREGQRQPLTVKETEKKREEERETERKRDRERDREREVQREREEGRQNLGSLAVTHWKLWQLEWTLHSLRSMAKITLCSACFRSFLL